MIFSLGSSSEEIGFPGVPAAETPQVFPAQQSQRLIGTLQDKKCPKSKSCSLALLFLPEEQDSQSFLAEGANCLDRTRDTCDTGQGGVTG